MAIDQLVARDPSLGAQFADAMAHAFDLIQMRPRQSARLETNRTEFGVRRIILKQFKYLIIYRMVGDDPLVVALMHASQQPDAWRERKADA